MTNTDCSEPQEGRDSLRAEERHRLALELHDTVGQALALAKLQLVRMQQKLREPLNADTRSWFQRTVDALLAEIDLAIHSVQAEIFTLRQAPKEAPLGAALNLECQAFRRRVGIECTGRFEPSITLDIDRHQLNLLIVREALTNAARHAQATTVEVSLEREAERGVVSVCDNGIGMDVASLSTMASFGLQGMRARAVALGGEFTIDTTIKQGTRIKVLFPLDAPLENRSRLD